MGAFCATVRKVITRPESLCSQLDLEDWRSLRIVIGLDTVVRKASSTLVKWTLRQNFTLVGYPPMSILTVLFTLG